MLFLSCLLCLSLSFLYPLSFMQNMAEYEKDKWLI